MKLIFLDIDGVLNNMGWLHTMYSLGTDPMKLRRELLDRVSVGVLNDIVKWTGAKVVISSSWRWGRTLNDMRAILADNGFIGEVIGMTPVDGDLVKEILCMYGERIQRGHEIRAWLKNHIMEGLEVEAYVVIDDSGDMAGVEDHLVLLNHDTGLQAEHIPAILKKLDTPGGTP